MLELDQSSEVRIASLRILDVIQRKTGNFQNIDASEAGIRFRHKHPSCRERDGLAKPLMARLRSIAASTIGAFARWLANARRRRGC